MNSFFDNICVLIFVLGFGLIAPTMALAAFSGLF